MAASRFSVEVFDGLLQVPPFNPDDDTDQPPPVIQDFRSKLKQADGILICTPEYAMGVPGTLKNAIDWTVSSMDFSNKPVALITASLSGQKAHASLLETLRVIESKITSATSLVVSFAKTKVSAEGSITDETTREAVTNLIEAFSQLMVEVKGDS